MIAIVGPTSTGKTSLAVSISKNFNGVIVSADSRQVYKFMDIGTGKAPRKYEKINIVKKQGNWEIHGIKVYGYDLVLPDQYYSVYDFYNYVSYLKAKLHNKLLFLTGGTGFYVDVATGKGETSKIKPDFALRKSYEKLTTSDIKKILKTIDPKKYEKIDQNNRNRMIRAIEIANSKHKSRKLKKEPSEKHLVIGLSSRREFLYEKSDKWVEEIWAELIEETRDLVSKGYERTNPMQGIIYKTAVGYLNGDLNKTAALERIKFDLHSYIRRQLTWFKRNSDIIWLDVSENNYDQKAKHLVESYLRGELWKI